MMEHIIWADNPDFEDWREDLQEQYPECSEIELRNIMYETNSEYLEDERSTLSRIPIPNGIACVGSLGLWHGRVTGIPKGGALRSISDCLRSFVNGMSYCTFYVDEKGELRTEESHHDGTNYYWFRAYKPDTSEAQKERLNELIYNNQEYDAYLRRITYRLGDLIGDIYGWTFPHRPKASIGTAS